MYSVRDILSYCVAIGGQSHSGKTWFAPNSISARTSMTEEIEGDNFGDICNDYLWLWPVARQPRRV